MNIEIFPLEKVLIDGISIYFGMDQSNVETALGKGQVIRNRHYYRNSEIAIDFDENKEVEFVEFLGGIEGSLRPKIYGISVFESNAEDLADLLKQKNNGEVKDSERGYSLVFENISIGVYRETTPSDVAEMADEMKTLGIPTEDNEDLATELRKANHWATIGAGNVGYYKR